MIHFMERPDVRVLKAFTRLVAAQDFQVVLEWLENSRQNALDVLPKIDENNSLTSLAGGVSVLAEILSEVRSAPETLEKLGG